MIAAGSCNKRSCKRAYECMGHVPCVVDNGNFICNKVYDCKNDERDNTPITRDKGEGRIYFVQMKPAYGYCK